jgi:hypothetical protein
MCVFAALPAAAAAAGAGTAAATAATAASASFLTPGLMTGLQIASSAFGLYNQIQQQQTMERYNQQVYDNQMQAYRFNQANNNFTRIQEAENLAQQKVSNNAAARRAQSRAKVSAGESGVTGLSVDALLAELGGMAGQDNANAETNYLRRDRAIQAEGYNNYVTTASNINKLETPKSPDYFSAALKIGQSVYDYQNPRLSRA